MKKLLCIGLLAALITSSDIRAGWRYEMSFDVPSWVPNFDLSTISLNKFSGHDDNWMIVSVNKVFLASVAAYGGYKLYKAYYPDTPVQKEDEIATLENQNIVEVDQVKSEDSKTIEQNSQENPESTIIQKLQSEDIKNKWQTAAYKAVTASAIIFAAVKILDSDTFARITDNACYALYHFLIRHGL